MNDDATLDTVARAVRSARTAAGLSLDALAARAAVSKGALVALEGARGNPNLTTLVRLADALGRSVWSLMEDAREDPVLVVDAGEVAPLWSGPSDGTARLLLTSPRPAPVEVWRWRLYPRERHASHAHPPSVTETLTVVRGQILLVLGDSARPLRAGQTTAFASDVHHAYEGAGRGPCELIMTVHLPMEYRNAKPTSEVHVDPAVHAGIPAPDWRASSRCGARSSSRAAAKICVDAGPGG